MKHFFRIFSLSSFVLIATLGWQTTLADSPNTLGITVSPPTYDMSANPGDSLQNTIRVTNDSDGSVTLAVSAQDFVVEGTEGSVTVTDTTGPTTFSSWFSFSQKQVTLAAKSSALVPFTINVPANAEPGGHFATVLFNPIVSTSTTSTGASIIQRVGSLVLMKVSGDIVESGSIEKFNAKSFVGSWETVTGTDGKTQIYIANAEDLTKEHPQSYFDHGPVAFDVLFKNTGNVHFKPTGTLTIYNIFGSKVDQIALDPLNVFPGGERRVTVIWTKKSLWGGYYRAQIDAVYGSQNKILTAETVFWVFPWLVLLIILLLVILIVVLHRRFYEAAKVLIKGR
ncbi:MAG: hypothetical protein ACHQUB_01835 [Candidatus Saccharimonadia bacterium]